MKTIMQKLLFIIIFTFSLINYVGAKSFTHVIDSTIYMEDGLFIKEFVDKDGNAITPPSNSDMGMAIDLNFKMDKI